MVATKTSAFGRPAEFPLLTLFILLGHKFDSGLGYPTFVAQLASTPQLFHRWIKLVARRRPPPRRVAVDSIRPYHSTGGEWMSLRLKRTLKRWFTVLLAAVDTDTLMVHTVKVEARPRGDAKEMTTLLKRAPHQSLEIAYGDKAHFSRENVQFVSDPGVYAAGEPKQPLKAQSRGHSDNKELGREC